VGLDLRGIMKKKTIEDVCERELWQKLYA